MFVLLKTEKFAADFRESAGQTTTLAVNNSSDMARRWRNTSPLPTYSIEPPLLVETAMGNRPPWSLAKMRADSPICFRQYVHEIFELLGLTLTNVGSNKPIARASTAIRTISSSNVNPATLGYCQLIRIRSWQRQPVRR